MLSAAPEENIIRIFAQFVDVVEVSGSILIGMKPVGRMLLAYRPQLLSNKQFSGVPVDDYAADGLLSLRATVFMFADLDLDYR